MHAEVVSRHFDVCAKASPSMHDIAWPRWNRPKDPTRAIKTKPQALCKLIAAQKKPANDYFWWKRTNIHTKLVGMRLGRRKPYHPKNNFHYPCFMSFVWLPSDQWPFRTRKWKRRVPDEASLAEAQRLLQRQLEEECARSSHCQGGWPNTPFYFQCTEMNWLLWFLQTFFCLTESFWGMKRYLSSKKR